MAEKEQKKNRRARLMKKANREEKQQREEKFLTKLPVLGYFFRKIKKDRQAIETTLKTGKETRGEVKKRSFLGIIKIISGKTFNILKGKW